MQTVLTILCCTAAAGYLVRYTWRQLTQQAGEQSACGQCPAARDGASRKQLVSLQWGDSEDERRKA